jgi:hypothetical protein
VGLGPRDCTLAVWVGESGLSVGFLSPWERRHGNHRLSLVNSSHSVCLRLCISAEGWGRAGQVGLAGLSDWYSLHLY